MDALAQGVQLYQQGKYAEALPLLTQAVQNSPQDAAAWTYLALAHLELNKTREALASAERALSLNQQHAWAWVAKGRALGALDRPEEGLAACDRAIALDANLASANLAKGKILGHEGREQEALGEFEQALRIDGTSFEAIRCKGVTLLELEQLRQAEIVADRMLRLFPKAKQSWMIKAQSQAGQERYDEAQQTIGRAVTMNPQDADVLMLQALIYGMAGDEGRARSILKQVTRNDPQNKEAAEVLAELTRMRNARALAAGGRVAGGVVRGVGAVVGGIIKSV